MKALQAVEEQAPTSLAAARCWRGAVRALRAYGIEPPGSTASKKSDLSPTFISFCSSVTPHVTRRSPARGHVPERAVRAHRGEISPSSRGWTRELRIADAFRRRAKLRGDARNRCAGCAPAQRRRRSANMSGCASAGVMNARTRRMRSKRRAGACVLVAPTLRRGFDWIEALSTFPWRQRRMVVLTLKTPSSKRAGLSRDSRPEPSRVYPLPSLRNMSGAKRKPPCEHLKSSRASSPRTPLPRRRSSAPWWPSSKTSTWAAGRSAAPREEQVSAAEQASVIRVLAPICADKFEHAANASANLDELNKADSWKRDDMIVKAGWATFPASSPTARSPMPCAKAAGASRSNGRPRREVARAAEGCSIYSPAVGLTPSQIEPRAASRGFRFARDTNGQETGNQPQGRIRALRRGLRGRLAALQPARASRFAIDPKDGANTARLPWKTVLFRPRIASGTRRRSTTEQMISVPHWRVAIIPRSPTSLACSAPRWSGHASLLLRSPLSKRLGPPD